MLIRKVTQAEKNLSIAGKRTISPWIITVGCTAQNSLNQQALSSIL